VPKKLILVVIDGLTPDVFEEAVETGAAPTLAFLARHGTYARGISAFPSLTPVCLSTLATGALPNVHHIPHLVWWHRRERRLVEYGSSFAAIRAAGTKRSIFDAIFNMNEQHLSREAVTVYEALEGAGLTTAAVNVTCYRGGTPHHALLPGVAREAYGPKRFFFYNLFESDVTGAPMAFFSRSGGSIDAYAAAVGRWLVTRDGFDFLFFYLPDYDFASHALGPGGTQEALARSDAAVAALVEAAGGPDEFLERYAVIACSDHGQTRVEQAVSLQSAYEGVEDLVVAASNRAGQVYRLPGCKLEAAELARALDGSEAAGVVLYREDGEAVARRAGEELRFAPADGTWRTSGDLAILDQPDALERAWCALANPNAGDVLVSPPVGVEFLDLAGHGHLGGGSHGSLDAADSEVPVLTVGLDGRIPKRIADVAPLALTHFGVELPAYARPLADAA
jgi:type I phosphodiesterase/nucleotide pyrophosphatase